MNFCLPPSHAVFSFTHTQTAQVAKKLLTGSRVIAIKTRSSASENLIEDKVEVIVPHLAQPLIILYSDKQALKGDTE